MIAHSSSTRRLIAPVFACLVALASCAEEPEGGLPSVRVSTDPLMAKALSDPLMIDPDLAYRNEANAAVTVRYDHPLPPLVRTEELANQAREAARVELLADGPIPAMPIVFSGAGPHDFSDLNSADEILRAAGGPSQCATALRAGFEWSIEMPGASAIMPHGLVQQAAGVTNAQCTVRVVRYLAPVDVADVMEYHFTVADRARLRPALYDTPGSMLVGDGRTEQLVVHARALSGGITAVDLVYWAK